MSVDADKRCMRCGSPLLHGGQEPMCPVCLLRFALEPENDPDLEGPLFAAEGLDPLDPPAVPSHLEQLGDYQLLEEVGRGGMGIVFKARQVSLNRTVAVKVLPMGPLSSREAVERFRREATAVAALRHPNIIPIHGVGEVNGQPYYSMDYVAGRDLAEVVRHHPLPARQAAIYVLQISRAVQYAHEQGILHRDLKPANILVDDNDQPRIADFGLARRLTDDSDLTRTNEILGSPNFMPPEQGRGTHAVIGPASDVYSVGAVLYYLLTARPPFAAETFEATLARVLGEDPLPCRRLSPSVPKDLETLCLKCLEKEPERRFASAGALADELERFLAGKPIRSRSIGAVGRLRRWCQRKPAVAAMAVALIGVSGLGLYGVLSQWQRAEQNAAAERLQRQETEQMLHRLEWRRAEDLLGNQSVAGGLATLAIILRQDPGNLAIANRLLAELTHRNWTLPVYEPFLHDEEAHYAEFSPDGTRILTASTDNAVRLWDAMTGELLAPPLAHDVKVVRSMGPNYFAGGLKPIAGRFSPDGQFVATASVDNTARIWDARTGQPRTEPLVHGDWVASVQFNPDGTLLATTSRDGLIQLWCVATGQRVAPIMQHEQWVNFAEFSPDGTRLFTGADDGTAQIWDVASGRPVGVPIRHGGVVKAGRFSPDGRRVGTVSGDATARLWDAATGQPISPPLHHENQVVVLDFSPDGCWLATGSFDRTVRLWHGHTGAPQGRPLEHGSIVRWVEFSPDGERLLTAGEDKTTRFWDPRTSRLIGEPIQHQGAVWSARFSPDGQQLVTASSDGAVQVWDARPGMAQPRYLPVGSQPRWVRWSPEGRSVILGAWTPVGFDGITGRPWTDELRTEGRVSHVDFSPDGLRAVVSSNDEMVRLWDLTRGECVLHLYRGTGSRSACFSPDGRRVLTALDHRAAALWDADSGQLLHLLPHAPGSMVTWAEFSADGRLVLTASQQTIRTWDSDSGQLQHAWLAHDGEVTSAHFSPNGTRIVTASADGTARVWHVDSGAPVTPPLQHRAEVFQALFSPDGTRIVTASNDDTARLWDARSGALLGEPLRHGGAVLSARFSPDGDRVVTASEDGTARIWDGHSGQMLSSPFHHPQQVNDAVFHPDGQQMVTACQLRSGWIWDVPNMTRPVPDWLPDLAEAVAGQRIAMDGSEQRVTSTEFLELRRVFGQRPGNGPGVDWREWFLADRSRRPVGPGSKLSVQEAILRESEQARLGSSTLCPALPHFMAIDPGNGLLVARAAWIALEAYRSRGDTQWLDRAGWLSERAIAWAPAEAAAWWVRADWRAAAGDESGALESMQQGAQLPTTRARFWLAYGERLDRIGRDDVALGVWRKALEPDPDGLGLDELERRGLLLARSRLHARAGRMTEALVDHWQAYGVEVPLRDPRAPGYLLDLSMFYNANLNTDWHGMRFFTHNLSTLPLGRQNLGGIEFDLRGAIQLTSGINGSRNLQYPRAISGIPVEQTARRIHFLHAAVRPNSPGQVLGTYTIELADGQTDQHLIRMGINIAKWDQHSSWVHSEPVVAWEGISPAGIPVRLFHATWTNLHPDIAVQSVDFATTDEGQAPMLLAITVE